MMTARPMCRQGSYNRPKTLLYFQKSTRSTTFHCTNFTPTLNLCSQRLWPPVENRRTQARNAPPNSRRHHHYGDQITRDKCSGNDIMIPGYSPPLRRDRTSHGGGVAVWVKSGTAY